MPTPVLIGTDDSHSILHWLVMRQLFPDVELADLPRQPVNSLVSQVVSATAGVLASAAWQLQERTDATPRPEGVIEGPPLQPTWQDVCLWLASGRSAPEAEAL